MQDKTYIDPNALGIWCAALGRLLDELGSNEAEHVLSATQQRLAGAVIDTGLSFVEALESILLAIDALALGMGFEEGGVEEAQKGRHGIGILVIVLGIADSGCKDDGDEDEYGDTNKEDLGVRILEQDARGKRSHDTLALQLSKGEGGCS